MTELVSIIMPVRNGGEYLTECVDSILAQSYTNWELLVVDDHSTDKTWETLCNYASVDKRIKAFRNSGEGILPALRHAYGCSSGHLVTRMDADDIMEVDKLKLLTESTINGSVAVGLVNYFAENGVADGYRKYAGWLNELTQKAANFTDIYKECTVPSACWMLTREDLDRCGGFGDRYPEDYDLAFRMKKCGLKIEPIRQVLHQWRDHTGRASRNDPNYTDNRFLEIKTDYFLELDRNTSIPLTLIGAGKKGKEIAKLLQTQNVSFDWATNNPRKIGVNIFGIHLKSEAEISDLSQIIVAVAGKEGEQLRATYPKAFFFC